MQNKLQKHSELTASGGRGGKKKKQRQHKKPQMQQSGISSVCQKPDNLLGQTKHNNLWIHQFILQSNLGNRNLFPSKDRALSCQRFGH